MNMHTISRQITVCDNDDLEFPYQVICRRGFVSVPAIRKFKTLTEAQSFANSKLATKYYSRAMILTEVSL